MILTPLPLGPDHDLPGPLLTELTALYAANRAFHALSGDFPDPDDIRPEQVAAALAEEAANPGTEVLLAHSEGRLVGIAITLDQHPDPGDPDPWIGLLMVAADVQRRGHGRRLAALIEDRFRSAGRTAVRLAVLDTNPQGLAFWTALGYEVIDHRADRERGRPCAVLRNQLRVPRPAARIAVLDPDGSVFLFRYDSDEFGFHWALPGGGLEPGESLREGALRELAEETGWTDLEPGPLLCTWEHDFTRAGIPVRQHDHIYVTHGPHRPPTGPDLTTLRAEEGILAWRWWTRQELAEAPEPVWPPELARLLDESGEAGTRASTGP
ncbi:bifunctional GNAT family N-acetyltransferase/NUDIX hydrolase [Streptomyces sp. V4I2]|uniref:bifunctional GNAT family N-acetyltransferase/NUDIX hydrolase n=1 Tax=Streptomyces sp. V4I2 TaxID=3042280 RepID=UPI00278364A1|nr:bifunctional GNAT family N-acetyltransferase/NUDIX hydrolase [Streptomyces sp. V4I2]MDQ1046603.1 ADP-ribose pyrophosphatase YjhB (NUDIX family)/ribosomal protein S18 acetylase RimI-like enzyme [Streptomyces sp. V4I2]